MSSSFSFVKAIVMGCCSFVVPVIAMECHQPLRIARYYLNGEKTPACLDVVAAELLRDTPCPVHWVDVGDAAMARYQKMLQQGDVDIDLGLSRTPEREAYLQFSLPIGASKALLFARHDDARWSSLTSWCGTTMKSLRMLIPESGFYGPELERLRRDPTCAQSLHKFSEGFRQGYDMLMHHRADVLLATSSWWSQLPIEQQQRLQPLPLTGSAVNSHVVFRKDTVPVVMVAAVNQRIEQYLRVHGTVCGALPPAAEIK